MGLKYTKRAMTSYEVHRFFHSLEISFFPDTGPIHPRIKIRGWIGRFSLNITFRSKHVANDHLISKLLRSE